MAKTTISAGNFSNGMITDVIGAQDSMVEIVDGWIPRIGEIRKRGGKGQYEVITPAGQLRIGTKVSDLYIRSSDQDNDRYGFAFVGQDDVTGANTGTTGVWNVRRAGDASSVQLTRGNLVNDPGSGFFQNRVQSYGGGDSITVYGEQIISGAGFNTPGSLANKNSFIGRWSGALQDNSVGGGTVVTLTKGETKVTGTWVSANFREGQYIQFDNGVGTDPNDEAIYRIARIIGNDLMYLDRPWPGNTALNAEIQSTRYAIQRLGDPYQVGVNSGQVVETHQERLFVGRFDPVFIDGNVTGDNVHAFESHPSRLRWSAIYSENGSGDGDLWTFPTTVDEDLACYGENLWYPKGFVDVFPGQGGGITGLHSLGNTLVIIKEDATYALRGAVSSKGFPSGASLDVINNESGSSSIRGSAKTEIGVAWANDRGLWIYNGSQAVNLVDESIERMWTSTFTDTNKLIVSGVNDRIIVQQEGLEDAIVYFHDKRYFTKQKANPGTNVIPFGDPGFGTRELAVDDVTENIVDWSQDLTEANASDSENANFPRLSVQTQPIPADSEPFYTGRPNLLLVGGHFEVGMTTSIAYGRQEYNEFSFDPDAQIGDDDIFPLEYGVDARNYDSVHRIPVGGIASRPAHRVLLSQEDPAQYMRIYGIGLEYLEDFTVDKEDD